MAKRALKAEDVQPSYEGWSVSELRNRIRIITERGSKRDLRDIPHIMEVIASLQPKKNRVAEVNKELRNRGEQSQLRRGSGYYYFDGDACGWYSSSVYVYRADDLTVAEWMVEYEQLKNSPFNR